jgi:hypothetical protein
MWVKRPTKIYYDGGQWMWAKRPKYFQIDSDGGQ